MMIRASHQERVSAGGTRSYDAVLIYNDRVLTLARAYASRTGAQRAADDTLVKIQRLVDSYVRRRISA